MIERILHRLGLPPAEAISVSGGTDTEIWRVRAGDEEYALRLFREGQVARRDREANALRLAESGGVPVPGVRAVSQVDSRPVLLLDWSPGRTLLEALMSRPEEAASLGVAFGSVQAQIHDVPLGENAGAEMYEWIYWAGEIPTDLGAVLRDSSSHNHLLHLDYHPLNVLVRDGRITGVIDWANAHIGDRRADLARTETILRLVRPETTTSLPEFVEGWRRGYDETAGWPSDMSAYYAWAGQAMLHDLRLKASQDVLDRVREWTAEWTRRALSGTE